MNGHWFNIYLQKSPYLAMAVDLDQNEESVYHISSLSHFQFCFVHS